MVDLSRLPALHGIALDGQVLRMGGATISTGTEAVVKVKSMLAPLVGRDEVDL